MILLILLRELTFDLLKFPDLCLELNLPLFLLKLVAEVVNAIMKFLVSRADVSQLLLQARDVKCLLLNDSVLLINGTGELLSG